MPDNLQAAQWQEILPILRQTHRIWATGLNRSVYNAYIDLQMSLPWARRNYRYLIYRHQGQIVSSCKLYTVQLSSRGRTYQLAGIGAVFTQEERQNEGFGRRLIKSVIQKCKKEQYDGLLLFSEIGAEYYEHFGFEPLSRNNFALSLAQCDSPLQTGGQIAVEPLTAAHIDWMHRHYHRWLSRQPFGIKRDPDYLSYKLQRESYLHRFSQLSWPQLEILKLDSTALGQGYAIFEVAGQTLRVLEAIGLPEHQEALWNQLLRLAKQRQVERLRGWEATAPQHLPVFPVERTWGWTMILPLSSQIAGWSMISPCPLLELDHF